MKPVLFLDVDGVLNTDDFVLSVAQTPGYQGLDIVTQKEFLIDPEKLGILERLISETDSNIVLSTSWRHYDFTTKALLNRLRGVGLDDRVVGKTRERNEAARLLGWETKMSMYYPRGVSIHGWLQEHPEVERFAIVDDIPVAGKYQGRYEDLKYLLDYQVLTDFERGLTENDSQKLFQILAQER